MPKRKPKKGEWRPEPELVRKIRPAPRLAADVATVEISRYVRENGMEFDDSIGYREWYSIGETLFFLYEWTPFAIGDWLNYGERKFGESYAQAAKLSGRAIKTLYNLAWIAKEIPPDLRRSSLSIGHHDPVASAQFSDEEKKQLLDHAEREDRESMGHYTVPAFREYVRDYRMQKDILSPNERKERKPVVEEAYDIECPHCMGTGRIVRHKGT